MNRCPEGRTVAGCGGQPRPGRHEGGRETTAGKVSTMQRRKEKLEPDTAALVLGQFFFKYSLIPTNSWHSYKPVRCLSMKTGKTQAVQVTAKMRPTAGGRRSHPSSQHPRCRRVPGGAPGAEVPMEHREMCARHSPELEQPS